MPIQFTAREDLPVQYEGDDEPFTFTFRDEETNDPKDITDWTVTLTIKESPSDQTAVIQKSTSSHSDPTNGETTIELTEQDTSGVVGWFYYDIEVEDGDGDRRTILAGSVHYRDGVTDN